MLELWTFLELIAILSIIFIDRKKPNDALAWILVVSLIPFLGFILYLFFGDTISLKLHFRYYKENKEDENIKRFMTKQKEFLNKDHSLQGNEDYHDMITLLTNQSQSFYTTENKVEVLNDGQEKYPKLFEDIRNAKKSICIAYYIISDNQMGYDLMNLLIEKAKEGVEIRFIHDFFGVFFIYHRHRHFFEELEKCGGKVIRFLPSSMASILRINYRYHRKMVIIDSQIGYTGGINIGDEYLGKRKSCTPWRDTSIRMQGDCVYDLLLHFLKDWEFVRGEMKKKFDDHYEHLFEGISHQKVGNTALQLVSYGPQDETPHIRNGYIKMVNRAKKYLYIETPYFIPDEAFMTALKLAIDSGVDVRVIIPGIPDKKAVYYATLSYASELLQAGGKVYTHEGFIHSKSLVVDDHLTSIGTTNIDIRSFALDFEINAFMYDQEFALKNKEIFFNDITHSKEFTYQDYKKLPLFKRMLGSIVRLFSFLI